MANEDPNVLQTVLDFAQAYLRRPLTEVERQVLLAYIQRQPVDLAQGAQQSVDQARQRALEVIQSDGKRTRQLIDQVALSRQGDNAERDLLIQQVLAAAGAQVATSATPAASAATPAAAEPAAVAPAATPVPGSSVPATPDPAAAAAPTPALSVADPALRALLGELVRQEVKVALETAVETRMVALVQKVEETLKQIQAANEQ